MKYTKTSLERIYQDAFDQELKRRQGEGYVVKDQTGHVYEDTGPGKFYLCGFANLHYSCRDSEGRKLHKFFKEQGMEFSKGYYGGFNVYIDVARGHSNGMFEIMVTGYEAVAKALREEGYEVSVQSRLD